MASMGMGNDMSAMGSMGNAVSQYWNKHIADSVVLRLVVYVLAFMALLFQCLVILGCVPGSQGASSGTSSLYLLEFNAMNGPNTTVRLRMGYTAMCAVIGDGAEHCAVTVGKDDSRSQRLLSTGSTDADAFNTLPDDLKINTIMFNIAEQLQNNVFVVLPAVPGFFLAVGFIMFFVYGTMNRPWVGPASSWRQSQRNRKLDLMRLVVIILIGLSIVFSFAVAVANSQMFAANEYITSQNDESDQHSGFRLKRGTAALALHWLTVISTISFFVSVIQTNVEVSSITIDLTPDDTAGTSGGQFYAAPGDQIEKHSLLKNPEPMAMNRQGLTPQVPNGGTQAAGMGSGMGGGMGTGMRGSPMGMGSGMRGGPMGMGSGMRGSPMGMSRPMGGMGTMGRGMGMGGGGMTGRMI